MNEVQVDLRDALGRLHQVSFRSEFELANSGDSAYALSLPASLFGSGPLVLDQPVSRRILQNSDQLRHILRRFLNWRRHHRSEYFLPAPAAKARYIEIEARERATKTPAAGVGCFFTGGLDSFYTFECHKQEITHLIYVLGYDVFGHQQLLRSEVVARLEKIAAAEKKTLIVVETDLRRVTDKLFHWHMYNGAALAAVAHLLAPHLGRVYLPSTYTFEYLIPLGSHPMLDPLWSSYEVEIIHHGCDRGRPEKALLVGRSPLAREHLRVCWENPNQRYNCGECEKCERTRVEFAVAGWGGQIESLPGSPSLTKLAEMPVDIRNRKFWLACLDMARERNTEPSLIQALEQRLVDTPAKRVRLKLQKLRWRLKRLLARITG